MEKLSFRRFTRCSSHAHPIETRAGSGRRGSSNNIHLQRVNTKDMIQILIWLIPSNNQIQFPTNNSTIFFLWIHAYFTERLPPASVHYQGILLKSKKMNLKGRYRRVYWTKEEEEYLRKGVKKFGVGKWKQIIDFYPFNPCRTSVDAKDKWRNIKRQNSS